MFLQNNKFLRAIVYKAGDKRARTIVGWFKGYLNKEDKILDLGAGSCNIDEVLQKEGFNVLPLDVQNLSFVNGIEPVLFDEDKIPFKDKEFDVCLILTVLHHVKNPEKLLKEAMRVSKRIIIIEDIYKNNFEKYNTFFFDSLINLEFFGHPHSNKDNKGWRKTFDKLGLELLDVKKYRIYSVFNCAVYNLYVE